MTGRRAAETGVLTTRQRLILKVISDYWEQHGIAPTIRDVAGTVGCVASTAAYQIGELESVGVLTRRPRIPRSMQVVKQDGAA